MQMLMSFAAEPRAKTAASDILPGPGGQVTDWMATVLGLPLPSPESPGNIPLTGSFGRMCRTFWARGIPVDFSGLPLTLLKSGMLLPGECWISDTLGNPTSRAPGFGWSEIVQIQGAPLRFCLSRKAVVGIAKRKRKPRLFSPQEGAWLSMTERRAFWTRAAQE